MVFLIGSTGFFNQLLGSFRFLFLTSTFSSLCLQLNKYFIEQTDLTDVVETLAEWLTIRFFKLTVTCASDSLRAKAFETCVHVLISSSFSPTELIKPIVPSHSHFLSMYCAYSPRFPISKSIYI